MYEAYFGLKKRPFAAAPCADQYCPAAAIEAARKTLARCIQRAEGPAMVVGPSGTGKTLLCHLLAEQFKGQYRVVLPAGGGLGTRRALLQAILYGLGQPYRGLDEGELRLALVDCLTGGGEGDSLSSPRAKDMPAAMLLLLDEAHTLPLRLLDEVRMIASVVCGGQPRTRLVLAGSPILEERLASPKLESFSQRLAARCYLEAMNRCETEAYIHAQLEKAGVRGHGLFPPESCHAVHRATDGVPRLVNHVCDHVLLLAMAAGKSVVEPGHVEEAWSDLQQLPTPWNGENKSSQPGSGAVEFGAPG